MDKFYSEEFSDDRRHFTYMKFDESEDMLEEIVERADQMHQAAIARKHQRRRRRYDSCP